MKTKLMLKRTLFAAAGLAAVVLLSPPAQADPPDRENLPPGLRKKDKLPPGWEKKAGKRGASETASTPAATNAAPPAAGTVKTAEPPPAPASTPPTAPVPRPAEAPVTKAPTTTSGSASTAPAKALTKEQQQRQARLEKLLADFEVAAARPTATDRVLGRLARVTSTPEATLRDEWKAQPGATIGQFYVATLIAKHSRSKADQVLAEHKSGRSWGEVAVARKMPIASLNEAVAEATTAARNAAQTAERQSQRAQQTR